VFAPSRSLWFALDKFLQLGLVFTEGKGEHLKGSLHGLAPSLLASKKGWWGVAGTNALAY